MKLFQTFLDQVLSANRRFVSPIHNPQICETFCERTEYFFWETEKNFYQTNYYFSDQSLKGYNFALAHAESSEFKSLPTSLFSPSFKFFTLQTFDKNYLSIGEKISATNRLHKNFVGTRIILNSPDFCKLPPARLCKKPREMLKIIPLTKRLHSKK